MKKNQITSNIFFSSHLLITFFIQIYSIVKEVFKKRKLMQTRIKRKLKLFLSLIYLLSLSSCFTEKRLEFCECIDLKAMITDEFTLSKNDKEAKQKACMWIENELSTLEITEKTLNCWSTSSSNSNQTETSSSKSSPEKTEEKLDNSENNSNNLQSAVDYYNAGYSLTKSENYNEAIAQFNDAIILNPTYEKALLARGLCKQITKDYSGAIEDFDQVIAINPNYSEAYTSRGNANYSLNNKEAACNDYKTAISLGSQKANEFSSTRCN